MIEPFLHNFAFTSPDVSHNKKLKTKKLAVNKKITYLLLILLFSLSKTTISFSQKTIDEIETYIFAEIFESKNNIKAFVELNDEKDTVRYWHWNDKGQLIKEIDHRNNFWSFSLGGKSGTESTTHKKEFNYDYQDNGEIKSIVVKEYTDEDTTNTLRTYTYPTKNIINTYYKIDKGEDLKFDFRIIELMNGSQIEEETFIMINHIGDANLETIQRTTYEYHDDKKIKNRNFYFSVNSYSKNEKPDFDPEFLSSQSFYSYDKLRRIKTIKEIEITEEELQKLKRNITFNYKGNSTNIKSIKVIHGENFRPSEMDYKIRYRMNGSLKSIMKNGTNFHYIIK